MYSWKKKKKNGIKFICNQFSADFRIIALRVYRVVKVARYVATQQRDSSKSSQQWQTEVYRSVDRYRLVVSPAKKEERVFSFSIIISCPIVNRLADNDMLAYSLAGWYNSLVARCFRETSNETNDRLTRVRGSYLHFISRGHCYCRILPRGITPMNRTRQHVTHARVPRFVNMLGRWIAIELLIRTSTILVRGKWDGTVSTFKRGFL